MRCSTTLYFLLVLASYNASAEYEDDSSRYCRLCEHHTMCLFPFDDPSTRCKSIENGDLDLDEIASVVNEHNLHRNHIASGQETRGKPGPQPPAKNMMELTWDEELAKLARRWVLQCHPLQKDECRDVDRFPVWQNVHVLNIDKLETDTTSHHRIPFHVQSWLDDVENFDTAEVGMVDFSRENRGPYIGIAAGKITRMGCGRALYTVETWEKVGVSPLSSMVNDGPSTTRENKNTTGIVSVGNRVEVLVCNYGPIDRATPRNLYDDGMPGNCPVGFSPSQRYDYLCKAAEETEDEHWFNENGRSSTGVRHCATIPLLFVLHRSLLALLSTT